MKGAVYDAGVFVAAEKNDRAVWAEHAVRLAAGIVPSAPATVVAQVSRSPRQAQLRRFLRGCEVVAFDEGRAHRSGALLGKAGTSDIVDASVLELAIARDAQIVTRDRDDIERLVAASGKRILVIQS
jgi:hypothetical protein